MDRVRLLIVGAGSRGFYTFGKIASDMSDEFEIVGVVEPDDRKRERFVKEYSPKYSFKTWEDVLKREKIVDVVVIATPDHLHVKPAIAFAKAGYHILLEKPIAPKVEDLVFMERELSGVDVVILVAHVLRYTPFYRKIKEIVESGIIGNIKGIDHQERVGYFHFAHSFVRGNWRRSDETAPSILTKSCHDTDIILWLVGKKIEELSAFGDLLYFKRENMPEGAAERCLDCPLKDDCPYSAVRIYLTDYTGWPVNTITTDLSYEGRLKALKEGPYGRCVFACDNDVCDYYSVSFKMEGNTMGSFTLTGFSNEITRKTMIFGTHGEIEGDLLKGEIVLKRYGKGEEVIEVSGEGYHMGGDEGLMEHLYKVVRGMEEPLTTFEESLESHYIAFAVEKSRVEKKFVKLEDFKRSVRGDS